MYKVNNSKLSEQNTKLMIALANSKGSQDSLEKQLSEAVALGSYELTNDGSASKASKAAAKVPSSSPAATGSTPKLLSKKELKKLRQKTRKRLLSLQAKEAEDITEDDDNLIDTLRFKLTTARDRMHAAMIELSATCRAYNQLGPGDGLDIIKEEINFDIFKDRHQGWWTDDEPGW